MVRVGMGRTSEGGTAVFYIQGSFDKMLEAVILFTVLAGVTRVYTLHGETKTLVGEFQQPGSYNMVLGTFPMRPYALSHGAWYLPSLWRVHICVFPSKKVQKEMGLTRPASTSCLVSLAL